MEKLHKFSNIFLKLGLTTAAILLAIAFYNFSKNGRYSSAVTQTSTSEGGKYSIITITDTQTGKTAILGADLNDDQFFAVDPQKPFKELAERTSSSSTTTTLKSTQ